MATAAVSVATDVGSSAAAAAAKSALYGILEVDENASAAEVKASYDRLAKNLAENPTPSNKQKQLLLNQAYVILTDPKKRQVYDMYGDKAWELLQNPYADAMFRNMESHTLIRWILGLVVVLIGLSFMLTVLAALRIDETVTWGWGWILLPVWIYDGIGAAVLIYLVWNAFQAWNYRTYEQEGLTEAQLKRIRIDQVVIQIFYWSYILFTIAVGWGLDRPRRALPGLYVLLLTLAEFLGLVSSLPRCHPDAVRAKLDAQAGNHTPAFEVGFMVTLGVIAACWRVPFLIMIGFNVSWVNSQINWFVVCIPLFLAVIAFWEYGYTFAKQKTTSKLQALLCIVPLTLIQVLFLFSVLLVCGKLEGAGRSVGDALVPFYITQLILIATAVGILVAFNFYDKEMRVAAQARQYVQPGSGLAGVVSVVQQVQRGAPPPKTVTLA